ncbi:MAG TPA: sensor histidine kinase [Nocardioides sp.]|uniref:sensor histidine kinase n=1 Tax=Nocardioides sp. TaxID=35761 RepID=UPI002D8104CD|nr:sensor histidine kinase [Nocardioides sp.]HET6652959.1 sensor histidine kinase [Nocardioides sp.]
MTWLTRRRTRREVAVSALVLGGLTLFVVLVYVVVVLGGGALVGRTSSPDLVLSVVATVIVAVAFDRVQSTLERTATRGVYGDAAPPYDVLERFTSTVIGSYPVEEVPARMARVLAEGTGARAAEVWLTVQDLPTLAATWPPGADPLPVEAAGRRSLPVRYAGEPLGVLVVQEQAPLTTVEERLFAGLADQAGLVLRSAALRVQLQRRVQELSARAEELRASRQRLVDLQDERRRVLERDIHDGAQQHLVALAVNLRLAQTLAGRSPDRSAELLAAQQQATADAIDTLVQLSRGIYPPLLADAGLTSAVRAAAATSPVPVTVVADIGRYDARIEAAAYFACLEALQNAAKHSGATSVRVSLSDGSESVVLTVEDDGHGFDPSTVPAGAGLANLRDRVESVGGTLTTTSGQGRGTRVEAVLPARVVEVA